MIGVENQRDIEHPSFIGFRFFTAKHIEEILRDREVPIRCDDLLAVADPIPRRGERTDLAGDANRGPYRSFAISSLAFRIVKIER